MSASKKKAANPACDAAIALYEGIEREYIAAVEATGVTFAPRDEARERAAALVEDLRARGVRVRNAGASIVTGAISPACVFCTGDCVSQTLEISNNCHRDCYFCFNPNQDDFAYYCEHFYPWRKTLDNLAKGERAPRAVALTGGEPLLYPDQAVEFFTRARELFPDAHLRLYTSGDLLTEDMAVRLRDAGLDEIRFSVKLEDSPRMQEKVFAKMALAHEYIPTLMVEMPVMPGTAEEMHALLRRFEELGVYSVNLLEFTYPLWNWEAFAARGFTLKNPPFPVMYDYFYAGSLAVEGSEEEALGLMVWAADEGLTLGLHYCSLENKHRSQIRQTNQRHEHINPVYALDYGDFFLKTAQVFGPDRAPVKAALRAAGCRDFAEDAENHSLSFHPRWLAKARAVSPDARFCISYNVVVDKNGTLMLRELKVEERRDAEPVQLSD